MITLITSIVGMLFKEPLWRILDTIDKRADNDTEREKARLTCKECEKLQGFPSDYTALDHADKPIPDGPRYKILGNTMACNVMCWIGNRIKTVATISTRSER